MNKTNEHESANAPAVGSSDLLGAVVAKLYRDQNDEDTISTLAPVTCSTQRIETCPQCGAGVIQTNLGGGKTDDYCEECGWPDENREATPDESNNVLGDTPAKPEHAKN